MEPKYTAGERIADGIIHVIGVTTGLIAVIVMMIVAIPSQPVSTTASLAIYGLAMLAMFGCSAAYHLIPVPGWKKTLRRIDQAAIFLKIAGTYTPFALIKMGGFVGYALLSSVWIIALAGAAGKLLLTQSWDRTAIALYLSLGWAGLATMQPLAASMSSTALTLLAIGGVLYSVGVIFHVWRSLPYQNAIWHLFVLAGTACHFAAVTCAIFA
jgi:hemolysin III